MANNTFELYDSDVISDSMKERMRVILTKFNNGISCNKFMDIYAVSLYLLLILFYSAVLKNNF